MKQEFPGWLLKYLRATIFGETYPQIRNIAIRYTNKKELLIRYYLDREPVDFDYESIEMVETELESVLVERINKIDLECVFHKGARKDIDPLDVVIYARREYDMEDNPVS